MEKVIFFAFRDDPMCFVHVLLNSLDLNDKGMDGKIILEGEAVKLVQEIADEKHFLNKLYVKVKERNLFIGACKACSNKLGAVEALGDEKIPLIGEMMGHPAMSDYIQRGYRIITF
jgi:hypothetical protein